jgi:hypothetical protein
MFYSKIANGFFHEGRPMPGDAVECPDELYDDMMISRPGKVMVPGPGDLPVWVDAPAAAVPPSVTMYQARYALIDAGRDDDVETTIENIQDQIKKKKAKAAWLTASTVERHSEFTLLIAAALGLTDEQVDDLFIAASQVQ